MTRRDAPCGELRGPATNRERDLSRFRYRDRRGCFRRSGISSARSPQPSCDDGSAVAAFEWREGGWRACAGLGRRHGVLTVAVQRGRGWRTEQHGVPRTSRERAARSPPDPRLAHGNCQQSKKHSVQNAASSRLQGSPHLPSRSSPTPACSCAISLPRRPRSLFMRSCFLPFVVHPVNEMKGKADPSWPRSVPLKAAEGRPAPPLPGGRPVKIPEKPRVARAAHTQRSSAPIRSRDLANREQDPVRGEPSRTA